MSERRPGFRAGDWSLGVVVFLVVGAVVSLLLAPLPLVLLEGNLGTYEVFMGRGGLDAPLLAGLGIAAACGGFELARIRRRDDGAVVAGIALWLFCSVFVALGFPVGGGAELLFFAVFMSLAVLVLGLPAWLAMGMVVYVAARLFPAPPPVLPAQHEPSQEAVSWSRFGGSG